MRSVCRIAALVTLCALVPPALLAADADEARSNFEAIVQGLNDNSFEKFHRAMDKKDLTARIYGSRLVEPDIKSAFGRDFSTSIERMYISSFPKSRKEILGTLIDFQVTGNEARAVVRFAAAGYQYSYHVYELQVDARGRPSIVDWLDYYKGGLFSRIAGDALVMSMPSKPATRHMLGNKRLTDGQVFQLGELFKAVRDDKPERFFQIYDGLDEGLQKERVVAELNMQTALLVRNSERAEQAVQRLVGSYPDDPMHSLSLIQYYIPTGQFQKAIDALLLLQEDLGIKDGATESLKASAALALGNSADAEQYAQQATVVEPTLELSWWSLLRARTSAGDYEGATEALARLEDDFGHLLDADKLKKDRFLKVLSDKQAYLDWRAARD